MGTGKKEVHSQLANRPRKMTGQVSSAADPRFASAASVRFLFTDDEVVVPVGNHLVSNMPVTLRVTEHSRKDHPLPLTMLSRKEAHKIDAALARGRAAQVSMEYLIIIGFALLVTLPIILLFFTSATDLSRDVTLHEAQRIVTEVASAAEKVAFVGPPAQITLSVHMPQNIESVGISGHEVMLRARLRESETDIYQVSTVNVTGNISHTPGVKHVLVMAQNGFVNVSEIP